MSNSEILGMVGWLILYAAVGLGLLVGACLIANQVAYWVEDRAARRHAQTDVADRCNVYQLHPATVTDIRSRQGDDAA